MNMKQSWKDFFYYSKSDRVAIWIILTIVIAVIAGFTGYYIADKESSGRLSPEEQRMYKEIQAGVEKRKEQMYKKAPYYYQPSEENQSELFYFDPNTADSTHFLRLGLRPYIVRNIYKYRAKGGVFRKPEDFAKLYGLSPEMFTRLKPFIKIGGKVAYEDSVRQAKERAWTMKRDSINRLKPEKYAEGVVIDLNTADTTDLKKIPGIGSAYAAAIVRYRNLLGGYIAVSQLSEIGIPSEAYPWLKILSGSVTRLKVNSSSFSHLNRHPYLNFYQTKAICEHRRKYGALKDVSQLRLYSAFTPHDLRRIEPYLDFSRK